MTYRFRYEALLSYRRHLKEMAEFELSLEQKRLNENRDLLNNLNEALQEAMSDLAAEMRGKIPSHFIRDHSEYISVQRRRIGLQEDAIEKSKETVEAKLKALLKKTQEYKVIEKLKQKDIKKWKKEQLLMEQQEINETAIIRHGKNFI